MSFSLELMGINGRITPYGRKSVVTLHQKSDGIIVVLIVRPMTTG